MELVKTGHKAYKPSCYWVFGDSGWYLADYSGDVYSNRFGLWLSTPNGLVRVERRDFIGE